MVNKQSKLKQWLTPLIKLSIAAGLIYWLMDSGAFSLDSLKMISSPSLWLFGVCAFLVLLSVNSVRWKILLQFENVKISFWQAYRLSTMGIFFNFFMPGGMGGDVIKAAYLMRDYKDKKLFIGYSILVDRVLGLIALMLYSGITGLIFYPQLSGDLQASVYSLSLLIVIGFVGLVLVLALSPKEKINQLLRIHPVLEKVLLPLFYFFEKPKKIVMPFVLSLVGQGIVISMGTYLLYHTGSSIPLWMVLLVFPFGFLATVLPIAPAGVGVGQTAFKFLFDMVAGDGEIGILVITFFQGVQALVGLLGGLLFVLYKKKGE